MPNSSHNHSARLESLQRRHAELDAEIAVEQAKPSPDSLRIQTLKKAKLKVKEALNSGST